MKENLSGRRWNKLFIKRERAKAEVKQAIVRANEI